MVNVEYKLKNTVSTGVAISNTASIGSHFTLSQGDTDQTRDGNTVRWKSYYLKYFITQHASATQTQVRVMVLIDLKPAGAVPAVSDIFFDSSATDILVSQRNPVNSDRFLILYDRLHMMSSAGKNFDQGKFYKKMSFKVKYSGTAGTVADLFDKNLISLVISNEATNTPTFTGQHTLRFIDN